MAFKEQNLSCIANNQKTGVIPAKWMYFNADSDTVTTAGFIPANFGMSDKDQVEVIDANGANSKRYHATVSAGVVTLVANTNA